MKMTRTESLTPKAEERLTIEETQERATTTYRCYEDANGDADMMS